MTGTREEAALTAKGRGTRQRILDVAAELFYEHSSSSTTNEQLRSAAGVSGSQLNHYFPSRAALVDAVLAKRVADAIDPARFPESQMPHSLATLRQWADQYVNQADTLRGGCRLGSLAAELMKTSPESRDQVAEGFERWRLALREGFATMKANGELTEGADTDYLSFVVLSALQGGLLLAQACASSTALKAAMDGALEVVDKYAATDRGRLES